MCGLTCAGAAKRRLRNVLRGGFGADSLPTLINALPQITRTVARSGDSYPGKWGAPAPPGLANLEPRAPSRTFSCQ